MGTYLNAPLGQQVPRVPKLHLSASSLAPILLLSEGEGKEAEGGGKAVSEGKGTGEVTGGSHA